MKYRILIYTALTFFVAQTTYGQKEIVDTLGANVKDMSAQSKDLYFEAIKANMHNDSKQAKELFQKFLTLQPSSASAYFELARLYEDERNPAEAKKAEDYIQKAISLNADNKWYKEEYATILAKRGRYEEAGKVIADIADKEKGDPSYAAMASEYYGRAQKFTEALTYIDKALVLSGGTDEDMLIRKVQICLELGDIEKAASVERQLIAQNSRSGKYYKMLGELYDNNKMPAKAMEVYESAEKVIPGDATIDIGLAEHYLKLGDTANYRIRARKAILNKKLDTDAQTDLFEAYLQGLNDSAIKTEGMPIIMELVAMHPNEPQLLATYADFLEADGQHEKAEENYKNSLSIKSSNFAVWERLLGVMTDAKEADSLIRYSEKAIRLFPNQASAHYYNGLGHYNKKEYPQATKALNRAVDMMPDTNPQGQAAIYAMLGDVYNLTKQYQLSDQSFAKALEHQPNDATVLNNYAYYLSERGERLDSARSMSERSLKIRPNETTFLDTYGWIYYKKGDYNKAKEAIETAVTSGNKKADATIYDHLGNIYYKLNNKAKAIENWNIAKEMGDENPLLDKKISEGKLYE